MATVSEVCNTDGWLLASPRSENSLSLHVYLTNISLPSSSDENDCFDWFVDNRCCQGYSAAKTWNVLRPRADIVSWNTAVWFKGHTPKNAFTMWTANLNRLPTKMRLSGWGMQLNTTCLLCLNAPETRDHLMLSCDYAIYLWQAVITRLQQPFQIFDNWPCLITWMSGRNARSPSTLRKIIVHAVVYALWKQRNNLLHNQVTILPSALLKGIDREVKNSITARRHLKRFKLLMPLWIN